MTWRKAEHGTGAPLARAASWRSMINARTASCSRVVAAAINAFSVASVAGSRSCSKPPCAIASLYRSGVVTRVRQGR